jgi:hypothetical protein
MKTRRLALMIALVSVLPAAPSAFAAVTNGSAPDLGAYEYVPEPGGLAAGPIYDLQILLGVPPAAGTIYNVAEQKKTMNASRIHFIQNGLVPNHFSR